VIQAWDFRPGGNFVLELQQAATDTHMTMAVLSDNYLRAEYTHPEWAAAFARDPQGQQRSLIPIRVRECTPRGLLGPIQCVALVALSEQDARVAILGTFSGRAKPLQAPAFLERAAGRHRPSLSVLC
jgi:TIR domain